MDAILAARAEKSVGRTEKGRRKGHPKSGEVRFLSSLGYSPVEPADCLGSRGRNVLFAAFRPRQIQARFQSNDDFA